MIPQDLFQQRMSLGDCRLLCCFMHAYEAPSGVELLSEGAPGDHMLVLFEGRVDVLRMDLSGRPRRLAQVGPGAFLGEMSLIDGDRRIASCITLGETRFAVITHEGLKEILATHARLANKLLLWLLETCIARLREMDMRAIPGQAVFLA
ncbi:MAG: cyclic nucleotide-binding domain-containing protein [Rhodocyclaceae bacterium]|nr:cyclic nucleotide-binding domain-containing protein [Rhodocyclaceae bacterium]